MMDDTISRAAAIDAVNNMIRRKFGISADLGTGALLELPSVTDTNVGGNLIDRQAALDAIKKLEKPAPTAQHLSAIFDCEDTIKALPSAQRYTDEEVQKIQDLEQLEIEKAFQLGREDAQPGWIPCKTALPKESGQYLITVKYVHVDGYEDIYAEHGEWDGKKWDMFCFGHCGEVEAILAWMPLPEAWKVGQDE